MTPDPPDGRGGVYACEDVRVTSVLVCLVPGREATSVSCAVQQGECCFAGAAVVHPGAGSCRNAQNDDPANKSHNRKGDGGGWIGESGARAETNTADGAQKRTPSISSNTSISGGVQPVASMKSAPYGPQL